MSAARERGADAPRPHSWRTRLAHTLLFGRGADRGARARGRIGFIMIVFGLVYAVIAGRLIMFAVIGDRQATRQTASQDAIATARPDIVDRNGDILATDVKASSLFGEPRRIIDKDEAIELLSAVLPDLEAAEVRERLRSRKGFIWLKREITAQQQAEIHRLGIPGVGFLRENKRAYPNGRVVSHLIGHVNIDNQGIAGVEKWLDGRGLADLHRAGFASDRQQKPVELAVDVRVEHALRDELLKAQAKYKAKAAAGLVSDVRTGEIVAMVSLPDYDPNNPREANDPTRINRLTTGVFEMGSTFKALTLAMALDAPKVNLNSRIDARGALRYGRFKINDYHAQNRALTVPEVFTYSSNVGTARMALMVGVEGHKAFLRKVGQLDRMRTELPESAEPIVPKNWGELNTMTIAFGHGLAVAPLQAMMAVGALTNGGYLITPTFLKRTEEEARKNAPRVIKPETSEAMRYLMRLNAEVGSAKNVNIAGYYAGGKTGTAEKVINGRYSKEKLFTTFMAIAPADKPKYLYLTVMDEPQGLPETHGYRTAAWNSGMVTGKIVERTGPLLGLPPRFEIPDKPFPLLARLGYGLQTAQATSTGAR